MPTHFSQSLFGLWIRELEQIAAKFVKKEGIEEVVIRNVVIMLLLYADVLFFANTLGEAQKLMKALEKHCMNTKFNSIEVSWHEY